MYENVRAVTCGLALSLIFIGIAAIVAIIDPFQNGVSWANWLTLSVVSVLAVASATWLAIEADDDGDFWVLLMAVVFGWAVIGGFAGLIATGSSNGVRPEYHPLVWSAWAVPLGVLPISALVQYLVAAAASQRDSTSLRRVA